MVRQWLMKELCTGIVGFARCVTLPREQHGLVSIFDKYKTDIYRIPITRAGDYNEVIKNVKTLYSKIKFDYVFSF